MGLLSTFVCFESHPAVLRADSRFYIQRSLLAGLRNNMGCKGMNLGWPPCKASVLLSVLSIQPCHARGWIRRG